MATEFRALHFEPTEDTIQVTWKSGTGTDTFPGAVTAIDFQDKGVLVEWRQLSGPPEEAAIRHLAFIPYANLVKIIQQYNDQD
jgi:hypothetical protein